MKVCEMQEALAGLPPGAEFVTGEALTTLYVIDVKEGRLRMMIVSAGKGSGLCAVPMDTDISRRTSMPGKQGGDDRAKRSDGGGGNGGNRGDAKLSLRKLFRFFIP